MKRDNNYGDDDNSDSNTIRKTKNAAGEGMYARKLA